jgi:hypothetical protein
MRMPTMIAVCAVLFAFAGWVQGRASGAAKMATPATAQASPWTKSGASACQKLLTVDFLSSFLVHPAGKSEPLQSGEGCIYGSDLGSITLMIDLFDQITSEDWERLIKRSDPKAIALPGVGDKAMRVDNSYAVDAWKNGGRRCAVRLIPLDEPTKLTGEPLARKLGGICNQLFALP